MTQPPCRGGGPTRPAGVRTSALHRVPAGAVVREAEVLTAVSEDNAHPLHLRVDPYRLSTWEKSIAHDGIMASAVWWGERSCLDESTVYWLTITPVSTGFSSVQ
jgi:hypothetical protein